MPPIPPPKAYRAWDQYSSKEERIAVVRELLQSGKSEKETAEILKTTKGTIVGFRRRNNIPARPKKSTQQAVAPERPVEEPRPAAVAKTEIKVAGLELEPEVALPPRVLKLAAIEAHQCNHRDENGMRCAGVREPNSDFCWQHPND